MLFKSLYSRFDMVKEKTKEEAGIVNWESKVGLIEMSNSKRHRLNRLARAKIKAKESNVRNNALKKPPPKWWLCNDAERAEFSSALRGYNNSVGTKQNIRWKVPFHQMINGQVSVHFEIHLLQWHPSL